MKESDLVKTILKYLAEQGHFAWKNWSGMMSRKGISDILGCQKDTGIFFALEVKLPGQEASDDQKDFMFEADLRGAITKTIHSLEEVKKLRL